MKKPCKWYISLILLVLINSWKTSGMKFEQILILFILNTNRWISSLLEKKITRKLSSSANASFCSAFSLHNFWFTVGEALEWNLFSSPDKILGDIRLWLLVQVVSPVRGNIPTPTASHQEPDGLTVECHVQQDVPPHLPRDPQVGVHVLGNRPDIGKRKLTFILFLRR